ncbi:hypothetical protein N7490_005108 [Penicillium lividum]|nr:hypothetical protein N7490_005108 [Penicillium lividum]
MANQTCLPRLSRLDTKTQDMGSSGSSTRSASTSSPTMTIAMSHSTQTATKASPSTLSEDMEETLGLQDLELMMYWCTTTYHSMARDRATETLWQTVIPRLSLRFTCLRHGLLALSALQLSGTCTTPAGKWRYLLAAREHQSKALMGIHLDTTQELSDTQCDAHFALCSVMTVFSFAYCLTDDGLEEDDEQPDILDEFLEVFQLTRWLISAMMLNMDRVGDGELHALVRSEERRPRMPNMSQLVILALRRHNESEALLDPTHEKGTYQATIDHLSTSLEQLMNGSEPKDFALCWTFQVPVRFPELVGERRPFALVILAHFAVILHHLRETWWMGDWGIRILKEAVDELDPEWRGLLSWPVDAMGWFLPEAKV